jgi:hypothetical protein
MMAEHQGPDFTHDELLQQAAGNWNSLFFAMVDYLREQGLSPEDFIAWLGDRYAPGWDDLRGDMERIAYSAALNPVSLGSELRRYEVSEDAATIETTFDHLSDRGDDVDLLGGIYQPIMERLGVDFAWDREGGVTTLHLRQRR